MAEIQITTDASEKEKLQADKPCAVGVEAPEMDGCFIMERHMKGDKNDV